MTTIIATCIICKHENGIRHTAPIHCLCGSDVCDEHATKPNPKKPTEARMCQECGVALSHPMGAPAGRWIVAGEALNVPIFEDSRQSMAREKKAADRLPYGRKLPARWEQKRKPA